MQAAFCRASVAVVCAGIVGSVSAQTTVTWTGATGNGLWSDPANWSPAVVPQNSPTDSFVVVLPLQAPAPIVVDASMPADFAVDAIQGGVGVLHVETGQQLTVLQSSPEVANLEINGGGRVFYSSASSLTLGGTNSDRAITALAGGQFAANATALQIGAFPQTRVGAGMDGLIDLSQAQTLSLARPGNPDNSPGSLSLSTTSSGVIDLSGMHTIIGPAGGSISIGGNGGTVALDSLNDLGGASLDIDASGVGEIRLGSLTSSDTAIRIDVAEGRHVMMNALQTSSAQLDLKSESGALISANGLTHVGNGGSLWVVARSGGQADLSSLVSVEGTSFAFFEVWGQGSALDISSLAQLGEGDRRFNVYGGGHLAAPSLTSITGSPNAIFESVGQHSTIDLSNLQNADGGRFIVRDGGAIDLSGVQSAVHAYFRAGEDSQISLPGITHWAIGPVRANDGPRGAEAWGGLVDLTSVTSISFGGFGGGSNTVQLQAVDAGGVIDLSNLTRIDRTDTGTMLIRTFQDGQVLLPSLATVTNFYGEVRADGGVIDLSGLASLAGWNSPLFTASDGGHIDLSSLTDVGYTGFVVEDATIDLSAATTLSQGAGFTVRGYNGPTTLDVRHIGTSSPTVGLVLRAEGAGRLLGPNVQALTELSRIQVRNEALVSMPTLISIANTQIELSQRGQVDLNGVQSATDLEILVEGDAVLTMPSLETYLATPLSSQAPQWVAEGNAGIVLSSLHTIQNDFVGSDFRPTLEADGGFIDLPALQHVQMADGANEFRLRAVHDGEVRARSLNRISGAAIFSAFAEDAGSRIDLSGMTTLSGNSEFRFIAHRDAVIDVQELVTIDGARGQISVERGAQVLAGSLATVSGAIDFRLTAQQNATLDLPSLTSLDHTGELEAWGSGGGLVRMNMLATIDGTGRTEFRAWDGAVELHSLLSASAVQFEVRGAGVIEAPMLISVHNARLMARSGGVLQFDALQSFSVRDGIGSISAGGQGSVSRVAIPVIDLSDGVDGIASVGTSGGGLVDLSGTAFVNDAGGALLSVFSTDAGSQTFIGSVNGGATTLTARLGAAIDIGQEFSLGDGSAITVDSGGTLTIGGDLSLASDTAFSFGAASTLPIVSVGGTATLGGTFFLTNDEGLGFLSPTDVLLAGPVLGEFDIISGHLFADGSGVAVLYEPDAVQLMLTLAGDIDLDGAVTAFDAAAFQLGFGQTGSWIDGDFTGDGFVDLADLALLEGNFGRSGLGDGALPSPGSVGLFAAAGVLSMRRRRAIPGMKGAA